MAAQASPSESEALYQLAQEEALLFELPQHRLFRITGRDTERYLQGRLTQNIKSIGAGAGARSLVLTPQGRIAGLFSIHRGDDGYLLISDPGFGDDAAEKFVTALLQFKVADDVNVEALNDSFVLAALVGRNAAAVAAGLAGNTGEWLPSAAAMEHRRIAAAGDELTIIRSLRSELPSFDLLIPAGHKEEILSRLLEPEKPLCRRGSEEVRSMLRIAAGVPEFGVDIDEKTMATDIPVDDLVSFNKGCYAGQEAVEMSIARGRPNRRLVRLMYAGSAPLTAGSPVFTARDPGEVDQTKPCGTITSCAYFPARGETLALAMIKNKVEESAPLFAASGEPLTAA